MISDASGSGDRRLLAGFLAVLVLAGGVGVLAGSALGAGPLAEAVTGDRTLAASTSQEGVPTICDRDADGMVASYNDAIEPLPGIVKFPVTETTIHGVIGSDETDYTFETDAEGRVSSYGAGEPDDASLRFYMDCPTFQRIVDASASETVDVFWSEFQQGNVTLEGVGLVMWILVTFLNLVVGLGLSLADLGLSLGIALVVAFVVVGLLVLIALVAGAYLLYYLYRRYSGSESGSTTVQGPDDEDEDDVGEAGDGDDGDGGAGEGDSDGGDGAGAEDGETDAGDNAEDPDSPSNDDPDSPSDPDDADGSPTGEKS